jgi:pimeloyl-ACP methyl ester carboxylesterase
MDQNLNSPVSGITLKRVKANGIQIRYAEIGTGPLLLFCHGWPESWYSWRHQLVALAAAGYRCVAPDMRGYGGTEAPPAIESYTQLHLVGDMVELVKQLGEQHAIVIGHDWGAPVAYGCALLRPDLFRAVVGMSVPWTPPSYSDLLSALEKAGIKTFYMQYFQTPGVAEAELERDIATSLRRIYYSSSGDRHEPGQGFAVLPEGGGLLNNTVEPAALPSWLPQSDLDYYVSQFQAAGFRGGLNWYRNLRRSWELFGPWRGQTITQPALFIAGERDAVLKFPASKAQIDAYPQTLPGLRGCHIIDGAGHWIQRERAALVNQHLLAFLKSV